MSITAQMSKQLRDVYFGGNWTSVNIKTTLTGVTWQQATTKIESYNSILTLIYHINYYIYEVTKVLEGGPLEAKDKYSFEHPTIENQADWEALLEKGYAAATAFADLVENLPDSILLEDFTDSKYGSYYRNLAGIVEHAHYHLGQIVFLKKMLA